MTFYDCTKFTNRFKIHTGRVPEYLLNIVPKKREHVSSYNTCYKEDYILPRCSLQLFKNSFTPDAEKTMEFIKSSSKVSHLNQFIPEKLGDKS